MRCSTLFFTLVIAASVAVFASATPQDLPPMLPASPAANGPAAVAGLSAGAFMAVQMHMAYSSHFVGAGIIAGGPYYCAQDSQMNALMGCMAQPELLNVGTFEQALADCVSAGGCDATSNLARQKVYLFSGVDDSVVKQGVMQVLQQQYASVMPAASVQTEFGLAAEHGWPTQNYGSACDSLGAPYMINCAYNAAQAMLQQILANATHALNAPVASADSGSFFSLPQGKFTPQGVEPATLSLGNQAIVYAPAACRAAGANCGIVVALHGCQQTIDDVGNDFYTQTGLNELAEANGLVVLYPQAIKSYFSPTNPEGCFDWWGYTTAQYAQQTGPQVATIYAMMRYLQTGATA